MQDYQKSNLDTPPHALMRITITPVDNWDLYPTRIYVSATCYDATGKEIHRAVNTRFNYLDVPGSLAVCKDFHYILGILKTEKLANKPERCEVIIDDIVSFLLLTEQIPAYRKDLKSWCLKGRNVARKTGIPTTIKLGCTTRRALLTEHTHKPPSEGITPSLENTGDLTRRFIKEETRCRIL